MSEVYSDSQEFSKEALIREIGEQGVPELVLTSGQEAQVKGRFPGEQEIVFGLNQNHTPFAFFTDEGGSVHPYANDEDKNKVATQRTWAALELLLALLKTEEEAEETIDLREVVEWPEMREII